MDEDLNEQLDEQCENIVNADHYKTMIQTALELKTILQENIDCGEIEIEISDMFNMGSIKVELKDLFVSNTELFSRMISKADNFNIYPKANGNIQFDITFQSVLKRIK